MVLSSLALAKQTLFDELISSISPK